MVPEWKEPNENKKYLDLFSLKNSEQLPCFIAFKFNDDETIEQVVYKLSNDSQEDAFDSLRTIVELITNAESQILPEYKQTDAVFNNVKMDIESYVLCKGSRKEISYKRSYFKFIKRSKVISRQKLARNTIKKIRSLL